MGNLNTHFLDSLRGLKEILQYTYASERKRSFEKLSAEAEKSNKKIKNYITKTATVTSVLILFFSMLVLFVSAYLYIQKIVGVDAVIVPTVMIMSSFGAVTATANLGAGLTQTIASGNRVLDLLNDIPAVEEVTDKTNITFEGAELKDVSFSYGKETILDNFSLKII